jgi:hypothetical protein
MAGSHAGARLAAVAAVVVLSLVAVPAAAQKVTARDARGDMIRVQEGGSDPRPAPRAMIGDVERTSFRYLDRRVVVRTELAALQRTGRRLTVWFVGVEATRRDRNGHVIFITAARGRDVRCGGVRHRVDYADDVVRVSVPTRCLGRPHVVRFRLATEHVRRSWAYAWLDNGLAVATGDRQWTRWLSRG